MNVKLPPEQQRWLEGQVAAGYFASIDEALAAAVAAVMSIQGDDLAWAKSHVDQARASVARGDVLSGDEYLRRLDAKLETFRSS
jgi:antitoxin ParD1/3/4